MTKEDFLDQPPDGAALTAYDQAHLKLYLRLLDADADGADWKEVVEVLFGICAKTEPERAGASTPPSRPRQMDDPERLSANSSGPPSLR